MFDLPNDSIPNHPKLKNVSDKISELFVEYKLIPHKTVVLSPYSNTLADLPEVFWTELADSLMKNGFCVVTNSSGINEPPIKGTKGIFFSLEYAPQFIEHAGYFIGIRSGFCDVISGTSAKKMILYDKSNRFYMSSAYEYFSLKTMQLSEEAEEFEFDHNNISNILQNVLEHMEG